MMRTALSRTKRRAQIGTAASLAFGLLLASGSPAITRSSPALAIGLGQSQPAEAATGAPGAPSAPAAGAPSEARLGLGGPEARLELETGLGLDAGRILIGQPISLTLTITHPDGLAVIPARLPERWGDLEVTAQAAPRTERLSTGLLQTRQSIAVRPWITGTIETAALTVTLVEGASRGILPVTPARIAVDSILPPGKPLPRDIRPQAQIPQPSRWPLWLVGIALGASLIALAIRHRPRPVPPASPPPVPDPRTAAEIALAVLDRIDAEGLLADARTLEHYDRVSDCLRAYIEAEFGLPALDRTSQETLFALRTQGLALAQRSRLGRFLEEADLVKFARFEPDTAVASAYSQRARELIPALESARRSQRALAALQRAALTSLDEESK